VFAAVLGTIVAVFLPFVPMGAGFLLLIRIGLFVALVAVLFYKKAKLLLASGVFLCATFVFGGALFAVGLMAHGSITDALSLPVSNFPPGIMIAGGLLVYFLYKKVIARLKRVRDASDYMSEVEIDIFSSTFKGKAFLDTGNRLYDKGSDLPVVVLSAAMSLRILGEAGFEAVLRGNIKEVCKAARYIEYGGADGKKSKLLVLKPDALRFYIGQDLHTIKDVMIGLAFTQFQDAIAYDAILHPAIMKL